MLRTGKIKVGGKKKDQTYKIELGDEISFWLTDIEIEGFKIQDSKSKIQNPDKEYVGFGIHNLSSGIKPILSILYEDEYLMVVNKPPGINVHAGDHKTQESNIIDQVQDYLQGRYDSLTFRPALVHRIDRDTSGCLLIAKDKGALEFLLSELQAHDMDKVYHTIVVGIPTKRQDTIRVRLLRIPDAKKEAKVRVDEAGQSAVTHYKIIQNKSTHGSQSGISYALLECRIETGRTHQIRVHMAHIGHPVLGDRAYGDPSINSYARRDIGITRQLLHAHSLTFSHPHTHRRLTIEAPYPADFLSMIDSDKKDLQQTHSPGILPT